MKKRLVNRSFRAFDYHLIMGLGGDWLLVEQKESKRARVYPWHSRPVGGNSCCENEIDPPRFWPVLRINQPNAGVRHGTAAEEREEKRQKNRKSYMLGASLHGVQKAWVILAAAFCCAGFEGGPQGPQAVLRSLSTVITLCVWCVHSSCVFR